MSSIAVANPFPARAVSTFGKPGPHLELGYATQAYRHFERYLRWYHDSHRSHAGAVGLSGGYGEGKTHVLSWLADQARSGSPQPNVLYGKADTPSFFDIYKQFMRQLPRDMLVRLISDATLSIARQQAEVAVATQAVVARIREYSDLDQLVKEGNADPVAITNELRSQLLGKDDIPKAIPAMLLSVNDPSRGESAYRWLIGSSIDDLSAFGLAHNLKDIGGSIADSASTDLVAIDALEAVATLHRLAGVPLVLLVDQLEALVATSEGRREELFSFFKKFIEHLARQEALIFIAGTPEGWVPFRRDSIDRLYTRPPIDVGHLDRDETAALLDARLTASMPGTQTKFPADAVDALYEISGGNAREILETAYEMYERLDGHLEESTRDDVIVAAHESGSLEDRRVLALSIADEVLTRYGNVRSAIGLVGHSGERWAVDRMLSRDGRTVLALFAICATDKASEVRLSLQITEMIDYLSAEYPGVAIVVTMIGYVSEEITSLLDTVATTIAFRADDFAGRLESRVERIVTSEAGPGALVVTAQDIKPELNKIGQARALEADAVAENFNRNVAAAHEPERQRHDALTVWELVRELDRLRDVIVEERPPSDEREIIQGVIAANSLGKKDPRVDRLAELYLELVSMSASAHAFTNITSDLKTDRLALRSDLREAIRGRPEPTLSRWLRNWRFYAAYAFVALTIFAAIALNITNYYVQYTHYEHMLYAWNVGDLLMPRYFGAWLILMFMLLPLPFGPVLARRIDVVSRWDRIVRAANRALDRALSAERNRYIKVRSEE